MCEELVKTLRLRADLWEKMYDEDTVLKQAADAIEELQAGEKKFLRNISALEMENENLKRGGRWIPVTERLPEEEEVVLVWGGASVYTAKRHYEYGGPMWWKLNSKRHYCNPTHWMPLPTPPKEEI